MSGIFTSDTYLSYYVLLAAGMRSALIGRSVGVSAVDPFQHDPTFQIDLKTVDPWEVSSFDEPRETAPAPFREATTRPPYIFEAAPTQHSIADAYDIHWVDDMLPTQSDQPLLRPKSRKRQHAKTERTFASIKPSPAKRAKKDLPTRTTARGKENLAPSNVAEPQRAATSRIAVPMKVFHYKGINEIDLHINGETIEHLCGGAVYLPDFTQSIERNLHISRERDALGCRKFNRKPTPANVQNILTMVQSKLPTARVEIPDGTVYDDAVVFERVKAVATALAGTGMNTFISRVFFQRPSEYLNAGDSHRDYIENWHYRYYTRHMMFEVELLDVLREHYPRHGQHYPVPHPRAALAVDSDEDDDFNIAQQLHAVLPRSDFQKAIVAVLEAHLRKLSDPPRLTNKPDNLVKNPIEAVIAQSMYGHTRYIDEANFAELTALARKNLAKQKGFSRLQSLHIVLHLAFRYALNARYILFQEHSGNIAMSAWERNALVGNLKEVRDTLKSENKFTTTFPHMYRQMIGFIAKTKCYQNAA
ncbi:iron-containing alcohol dehydrogenase [Perkinsela sp. CCAP 1560/4]|nr:iron-containing alcohol dehydrogenase [Perkinsela sp. CCAP 1560/4]|eukprot:KNH04618.1 iron-containing alcohol dehydrogenase [Perkinsela sp. CCAP 1560/4]